MAHSLKLLKHISIQANLICKSGLRIGGQEPEIGIGSAENPVIKDARGIPYLPGSSLKGKLRSMLEYKFKKVKPNGSPCDCGEKFDVCPVCTLFGPHKNNRHTLGPSRLIFRDAFLTAQSMEEWEKARLEGKNFTEIKMENTIDRNSGVAIHPRQQERLYPGTAFRLNINVRVFEGDDEKKMVDTVLDGMKMLGNDSLGSSGTRGYGWVEIKDIEVKDL